MQCLKYTRTVGLLLLVWHDLRRVRCGRFMRCWARQRGWGRWRGILDDLPVPEAIEAVNMDWLLKEFPWADGQTIITMRAAVWTDAEAMSVVFDEVEVDNEQRQCVECGQPPTSLFKGTRCGNSKRCTTATEGVSRERGRRTSPCAGELWQTGGASLTSLGYTWEVLLGRRHAVGFRARCCSGRVIPSVF